MMLHPDILKQLNAYYTPGSRVELLRMNDQYSSLPTGSTGTVICVDDVGTIHVVWDCGSTLGVVFSEDECQKIKN